MLVVLAIVVALMLVLAVYRLAAYTLPVLIGVAAAIFAYETGAGPAGAGLAGLFASFAAMAIIARLYVSLPSPTLRAALAFLFTASAGVGGFAIMFALGRELVESEPWRYAIGLAAGASVAGAAWKRLTLQAV